MLSYEELQKLKVEPLTHEEWKFFRNRSIGALIQYQTTGEVLDAEIVPLILAMHKLPGVTTIWTCSGHSRESYIAQYPDVDPSAFDTEKAYIVLAGNTPEYEESLAYVISELNKQEKQEDSLGYTDNRIAIIYKHIVLDAAWEKMNRPYPCFCIEWKFNNTPENHARVLAYIQQLTSAIRKDFPSEQKEQA